MTLFTTPNRDFASKPLSSLVKFDVVCVNSSRLRIVFHIFPLWLPRALLFGEFFSCARLAATGTTNLIRPQKFMHASNAGQPYAPSRSLLWRTFRAIFRRKNDFFNLSDFHKTRQMWQEPMRLERTKLNTESGSAIVSSFMWIVDLHPQTETRVQIVTEKCCVFVYTKGRRSTVAYEYLHLHWWTNFSHWFEAKESEIKEQSLSLKTCNCLCRTIVHFRQMYLYTFKWITARTLSRN